MGQDAPEGVGDVELDTQEDVGKALRPLRVLDLRPGFIGGGSSEGGASSRRLVPVGDAMENTLGGLTGGGLGMLARSPRGRDGILMVSATNSSTGRSLYSLMARWRELSTARCFLDSWMRWISS